MIDKALTKVTRIQILISIATSIALIVDSIIISKFLGTTAMAGYGAVSPILMIIMAVSGIISTGSQIICAERIGKADTEGANRIVGLSIVITLLFSAFFIAVSYAFTNGLIHLIGVEPGTPLSQCASDYLRGFIIGTPGFVGMLTLLPYMQLDGNRKYSLLCMAAVTVFDAVFDLLAVFVFHSGIFGIGVASAMSYYAGTAVLLCHFLLRKGTLRIRFGRLPWGETGRIFSLGSSSAIQKVLRTVFGLTANRVLLANGGAGALAAFTVIASIANLANSCGQGISAGVLLLTSVLFGDEDKTSLMDLHRSMRKKSLTYNAVMMAFINIAAYPIALLFRKEGADISDVVMGLRLISFDFIFYSLCLSYRNYYQGIRMTWLAQLITVMEGYVFIGGFAVLLGMRFGLYGVCIAHPLAEIASLLLIAVVAFVKNRSLPARAEDFLLLRGDFGIPAEDIYETTVDDLDGVMEASLAVSDFAREHGMENQSDRRVMVLSLAVEELAKNVVNYGFDGKKKHHLDIRVSFKDEKVFLRLRDDCAKFSPVDYLNQFAEHREEGKMGITMISGLAADMKYVNTLGLNIVQITV